MSKKTLVKRAYPPEVGVPFRLEAGTVVDSTDPARRVRTLSRAQTIRPFAVDDYGDFLVLTWVGRGSYWQRVWFVDGVPSTREQAWKWEQTP